MEVLLLHISKLKGMGNRICGSTFLSTPKIDNFSHFILILISQIIYFGNDINLNH